MKYLRNSKLLFFVIFFINLSFFTPIENVYIISKGIQLSLISILNLTVPITCALMEIPTGVLGDYLGRKKTLWLSIFCFAINSLILVFANNFIGFFAFYLLEGLGWSFFTGNTDAIVVEDAKTKGFDIGTQLAFIYTGFSVAPIISGILNSIIISCNTSAYNHLIIATLIMKSFALIFVFFIHENARDRACCIAPLEIFVKTFKLILLNKQNRAIIIYEATGRLQFYIPVIVQSLLTNNMFNVKLYGIIYSIIQVINVFSQAWSNNILRKLGNRKILLLATIGLFFSVLSISTKNSIFIIIGFTLISAIGPIRNQPLMIIKNDSIDNSIRSTYLSSISCLVLIINFLMLSFIGFLYEFHPFISLVVLSLLVLVGGLVPLKFICKDI